MKIFVWFGDEEQVKLMKHIGYKPVALETADILPGLQTGMIDVVPLPPIYALSYQFYAPLPHMLNLNWSPFVGATSDMERSMNEWMLDIHPYSVEFEVKK